MAVSTARVAIISLFLIIGMVMAGLFMQPKMTMQAWAINERDFPANKTTEERIAFLLNYAILAPSTHNSQPWIFNVSGNEIRIFVNEQRWLRVADADKRELHISLGCALENLIIAAEHFGYTSRTVYFPGEGNLVANVIFEPETEPSKDPSLFNAVTRRQTNRQPYTGQAISSTDLERLQNLLQPFNQTVQIRFSLDPEVRNNFSHLVEQAEQIQYADANYKSELGHWLAAGGMGPTGIEALAAQMAVIFLDMGPEQIKKDTELLNRTPVLGFIMTNERDRKSQVIAGRAFERLWLAATAWGLALQPMSQALEVAQTKNKTALLLPSGSGSIQQIFRMGYAPAGSEHTPRRPLAEVMITLKK